MTSPLTFPSVTAAWTAAAGPRLAPPPALFDSAETPSGVLVAPAADPPPQPGVAVLLPKPGARLEVSVAPRLLLDFHWLREIPGAGVGGDLGLPLDTLLSTPLACTLAGNLLAVVDRQRGGRIRFRLLTSDLQPLSVAARPGPAVPDGRDTLARAILGIHEAQWLPAIAGDYRNRLARRLGLPPHQLSRAAEAWGASTPVSDPDIARAAGRLARYAATELSLAAIRRALDDPDSALDEWLLERLDSIAGFDHLKTNLRVATELAGRIWDAVYPAASRRCSAWLAASGRDRPQLLIDAAFQPAGAGLELYREALNLDFRRVLGHPPGASVLLNDARLTAAVPPCRIEVRLPFFDRKHWPFRWNTLAAAGIRSGEGLVTVEPSLLPHQSPSCRHAASVPFAAAALCTAARESAASTAAFSLAFEDRRVCAYPFRKHSQLLRMLKAYGLAAKGWDSSGRVSAVEAAWTLTMPSTSLALWLRAPWERDPGGCRAASAISNAVQRALRLWLPYCFFSDLDGYLDLAGAWPLIVYQCTRPRTNRDGEDLTHDIIVPGGGGFRGDRLRRGVNAQLAAAARNLARRNRGARATPYQVQAERVIHAVEKRPDRLNALFAAEAHIVQALIRMRERAADFAALPPVRAADTLSALVAGLANQFCRCLRRFSAKTGGVNLASLVLLEATAALHSALGGAAPMEATLRLRQPEAEFDHVVVNVVSR